MRGFGIETHFLRVDGRTGPSGGSKAEHMVRHLTALDGVDPARTVVIGDAADDALAARHVGARAVLYTGGSHGRASLEEAGVPVVDTLGEAVAEAERPAAWRLAAWPGATARSKAGRSGLRPVHPARVPHCA